MSNPYRKSVRHLDEIDIYQIANLYEVKSHAVFHAIKKLLCAGKRGAKDYEQDLMEAIESIERELQMQETAFPEEPEWEKFPHAKYARRSTVGYFIYGNDEPVGQEFWVRPVVESFDEQRIDVIGQNGGEPHYDDWRMKVDWSMASPHHNFASADDNGNIQFSMHLPSKECVMRPGK